MHLYIISGILLIVPIVDFALTAPVLVQEKRQACADMADIPEYPITVLGKRGLIEELGDEYSEKVIPKFENWFAKPEESSAVHESSSSATAPNPGPPTEPAQQLTGIHAPLSSPVNPTYFQPDKELLGAHVSQPNTGPSNPSAAFGSDHRLVAEEPSSPTKGSSTESGFEMVEKPPSSPEPSTELSTEPGFVMVDKSQSRPPVSLTDPTSWAL